MFDNYFGNSNIPIFNYNFLQILKHYLGYTDMRYTKRFHNGMKGNIMSIVRESELIEGEKCGKYRQEHINALLYALEMAENQILWQPKDFLIVHKIMFPFGGTLRTENVFSSGSFHMYADPYKVPMWTRLTKFCDELSDEPSWINIAKTHLDLCRIHPMTDGNGREARIFSNWHAVAVGFHPVKLMANRRKTYIQSLEDCDIERLAKLFEMSETTW